MNDNPISISKESISSEQKLQNIPNVAEIIMVMLGATLEENTKKMTQRELYGFYNITNELTNIICELN